MLLWIQRTLKSSQTMKRYHFTPIKVAINKRSQVTWGCGETGTSYITGMNVKLCYLCAKVCQFLRKLDIELPYDSATPRLGMHPKQMKTEAIRCFFTAAPFTIAKRYKQPKCPLTDHWINKLQYSYTME